jgi:hypothetical protein
MPRSPEMGFNPEEGKKPERKVKVVKKGTVQQPEKLDISLEDFTEVPNQEPRNKHGEVIPQTEKDWADDFRALVKLKKETSEEKLKEQARKNIDDLFKK